MVVYWMVCFLCSGAKKLEIGDNHNKLLGYKVIKCPCCDGKGKLGLKNYKRNPRSNTEDFL